MPVRPPAPDDLAERPPGAMVAARWREEHAAAVAARGVWRVRFERATGARTAERAWRVGMRGEQHAGRILQRVGHGWRVLHSVPHGARGDIDHLLIGPAGVFAVNTKHHPTARIQVDAGGVRVNGTLTDYPAAASRQAAHAARLLTCALGTPVVVHPVLLLHTGRRGQIDINGQPDGLLVLSTGEVSRVLRTAQPRLDPTQVDAVYAVARRAGTWTQRG